MTTSFWVLGTDTDVGKTYVTSLLALVLSQKHPGLKLCKPIASGAQKIEDDWVSADTEVFRSQFPGQQKFSEITPWVFPDALGPWSAAQNVGANLQAREVADHVLQMNKSSHLVVAEGIGGVCVPLNEKETFLDVVKLTAWPAVVVVGLKLGCINHTLLTLEALEAQKIPICCVVVNSCWEQTPPDVQESSLKEITSRHANTAHLPFQASMPMALGSIEKILNHFSWP